MRFCLLHLKYEMYFISSMLKYSYKYIYSTIYIFFSLIQKSENIIIHIISKKALNNFIQVYVNNVRTLYF